MATVVAKINTQADTSGFEKAKQGLTDLGNGVSSLESVIGKALPTISLALVSKAIIKFGEDCSKEFGEAERSLLQLKTACDINNVSFSRMNTLIETLSKKTQASDNDVSSLVGKISSLGKSTEDVEKLSNASVILSNITGKDLNTSFETLLNTQNGNIKAIRNYVPEVSRLSKEQLANLDVADLVIKKYQTISDKMAGGWAQTNKNLQDSFGNIKKTIGEMIADALEPLLVVITNVFNYLANNKEALIATLTAIGTAIGLILFAINPITGIIALIGTAITALMLVFGTLKILLLEIELVGLNVANTIFDAFSTMVNTVSKGLNGILEAYNLVAKIIKTPLASLIPDVDFSNSLGIDKVIDKLKTEIATAKKELNPTPADNGGKSGGNNDDKAINPVYKNAIESYYSNNANLGGSSPESNNASIIESYYSPRTNNAGSSTSVQEIFDKIDAINSNANIAKAKNNDTANRVEQTKIKLDLSGENGFGAYIAGNLKKTFTDLTKNTEVGKINKKAEESSDKAGGGLSGMLAGLFSGLSSITKLFSTGLLSSITSLSSVQKLLNPIQTILSAMMDVLEPVINSLLDPLIGILNTVGKVLGKMLVPILELLEPIIQLIATAFVYLYNYAIMPFANMVISAGVTLCNGFIALYNKLNWIWGGSDMASKDLSDYLLEAIDTSDLSNTDDDDDSSSSDSSASYTAVSDINVYITVPGILVGSNGMKELATTIRDEIRDLGGYNF